MTPPADHPNGAGGGPAVHAPAAGTTRTAPRRAAERRIGTGCASGPVAAPAVSVRLETDPPPATLAAWDELVGASPGTDVTQLSVWARVRAFEGYTPGYLLARRGGELVGGAQVLFRRLPGLGRVGYSSYGPLVAADGRDDVVQRFATALALLPRTRMTFLQPAEGDEDVRAALLRSGFRPSTAGIAPAGSVRLDLQRDEDEIRAGLPPRVRSWIRRWPENGVTVRPGDEQDVPTLARLMGLAAAVRGYARPPSEEYLRHLVRELSPTGNAALFVGEVRGIPVTADLVTVCGGLVRGRFGGFDRSGEGGRLLVPAAARWEIIRWARARGYRWLDFGGLHEGTLRDVLDRGIRHSDDWPGADQTKIKFGGEVFRYPGAVELVRPAPLRLAYDAVTGSERGRHLIERVKVGLRSRSPYRAAGRLARTVRPDSRRPA
jgi:lipid II:glycine glycyltransferase (peptidoglycan interpeptide bridge formation enzyme)